MEKSMKVEIEAPRHFMVGGRPMTLDQFTDQELETIGEEFTAQLLKGKAARIKAVEAAQAKRAEADKSGKK